MSILDGVTGYYSIGGVRAIWAVIQARALGTNVEIEVSAPGIEHRVQLRVRTTDASIFSEVLVRREYDVPVALAPKVIVDAGANVGYASVFYANKYPQAKIFAIEAAASNFRMLAKNAAPYENIIPIHAALWCIDGEISVSGVEFGHWGFRVSDHFRTSSEKVPAVTLETVMNQYGIGFIDILKLDIEGAEKEVLEGSRSWVDKVGVLAVETHDRFKPGCTLALEEAMAPFPFRRVNGEIQYFARNAPI